MLSPLATGVPSEATIEQISNHQLLNLIGTYDAWFYVPTRREEQRLAYDASLQGYKALVIQYKRFRPNKPDRTGRVTLSAAQHRTLTANFPKAPTPYVFYAFALHRNYAQLQAQFSKGAGIFFGLDMVFIDAHCIPVGSTSVRVKNPLVPTAAGKSTPAQAYSLFSVAGAFISCTMGARAALLAELTQRADAGGVRLPHLNLLWARVGNVP